MREYYIFQCPRCGEDVTSDDDYCQICGWLVDGSSYKTEPELVKNTKENETICSIVWLKEYRGYIFTQLKVDLTPTHLKGKLNFAMMNFNSHHFYIFKENEYPYLSENIQINLNLDNYDSFIKDGCTIFFDKKHFSSIDIGILKLFNYGND